MTYREWLMRSNEGAKFKQAFTASDSINDGEIRLAVVDVIHLMATKVYNKRGQDAY